MIYIHQICGSQISTTKISEIDVPILEHSDLGDKVKISKKFLVQIHWKLNSLCTRRVRNLIFVCQSSVLRRPRLLQAHFWPISCNYTYFLATKVRRSTILEIFPCQTGPEMACSGFGPLVDIFLA